MEKRHAFINRSKTTSLELNLRVVASLKSKADVLSR